MANIKRRQSLALEADYAISRVSALTSTLERYQQQQEHSDRLKVERAAAQPQAAPESLRKKKMARFEALMRRLTERQPEPASFQQELNAQMRDIFNKARPPHAPASLAKARPTFEEMQQRVRERMLLIESTQIGVRAQELKDEIARIERQLDRQTAEIAERMRQQDRRIFSLSVQQRQLKEALAKPMAPVDRRLAKAKSKSLEKETFKRLLDQESLDRRLVHAQATSVLLAYPEETPAVPARVHFLNLKRIQRPKPAQKPQVTPSSPPPQPERR